MCDERAYEEKGVEGCVGCVMKGCVDWMGYVRVCMLWKGCERGCRVLEGVE